MTLKEYHDELTKSYYSKTPFNGEILTKDVFEKLHTINYLKRELESSDTRSPIRKKISKEEISRRLMELEAK